MDFAKVFNSRKSQSVSFNSFKAIVFVTHIAASFQHTQVV